MMPVKTLFIFVSVCIFAIAAWWLVEQTDLPKNQRQLVDAADPALDTVNKQQPSLSAQARITNSNQTRDRLGVHSEQLSLLLEQGNYTAASGYLNQHYSELSTADLEQLRRYFRIQESALSRMQNSNELVSLYQAEIGVYDDLSVWSKLAEVAIKTKQWRLALNAALKSSLLENDGQRLAQWQLRLVAIAGSLRAELENQQDNIGILGLYQELVTAHPNYARFQLELAYAHLRLDQVDQAIPYLEALQYDLDLGDVSRSVLDKINERQTASLPSPDTTQSAPDSSQTEAYRVPLQRVGTNLIASVSVNQRQLAMLLDTGASITALDSKVIQGLNLPSTNQRIQISTANGVRQAQLYQIPRLQLGRFELRNHIVASIELGDSSQFAGLLGTDVLNAFGAQFAYVIDDAQSALIFHRKN